FALALATGAAVHLVAGMAGSRRARVAWGALALILVAHAIDLGSFSMHFVRATAAPEDAAPEARAAIHSLAGDGRVAFPLQWPAAVNRDEDDVGFFDSLVLARPYRALLDLGGAPPETNLEALDGASLDRRVLQALGVRVVVSQFDRPELRRVESVQGMGTFAVDQPAPRAQFVPLAGVHLVDATEIHRQLRNKDADLRLSLMLLPEDARHLPPGGTQSASPAAVAYQRESSDDAAVDVTCAGAGVLRMTEAWDPGWTATVDGVAAPVLCADDVFLAVPVAAGSHEVRFTFRTPGVVPGACISLASLASLLAVAWLAGRSQKLHC
ncbi:MAG: hypothetical protein JWM97_1715, partial [Phycisphaerales bacterium]|nr:hypothetical protein [Phycisphaerales bacterium]